MNTPNNKRKRDSQEKIEKTFLQLIQKKNISEMISPSDETPYLITSKQYKTILKNFGNLFSTEEKESL